MGLQQSVDLDSANFSLYLKFAQVNIEKVNSRYLGLSRLRLTQFSDDLNCVS